MKHRAAADRQTGVFYQSTTAPAIGGVTLAGFIRNGRGIPINPLRVYGRYALVYMVEGEGYFVEKGGAPLTIRPGDLMFVFPEIPHSYGPNPGKQWNEYYVVFEGPVFDVWRSRGLLDPKRPRMNLQPVNYWRRRLEAVVEQGTSLSVTCRLQQFLADALEHADAGAAKASDQAWLAEAKQWLDATVTDPPLRAEDVAERLGVSYELFRKRFAKLTGLPPAKYRDARLIDLASRLLNDRSLPLKQIADRCGFCDEFHFSRRFKQKIGFSPSEFRQRLSESKDEG